MKEWVIDKGKWKESGLLFDEFLILYLIDNEELEDLEIIYPFTSKEISQTLLVLQYNNWIRIEGQSWEDVIVTVKTTNLFKDKEAVDKIDFDEFWDNFPHKTPGGRILRAKSKMWGSELTKDYTTARDKYLRVVKSLKIHNQIISILKAKSKKQKSSDKEFENQLIVYINQRKWEIDSHFLEMKQSKVNRI